MDYPQAWKICKSVPPEQHHEKCSYRKGMLCDCEVIRTHPIYLEDYPDCPKPEWKTCGEWKNNKWINIENGRL